MDILAFDVESLPLVATSFKLFKTNIPHTNIIENQSIISVSWQWVGQKKCYSTSIADDKKRFENDVFNDKHPVTEFHKVLNTDKPFVLLAHNGSSFDIKKINTAFIKHSLEPVNERQMIDTLKSARRYFRFDSNRLDFLGRYLELGEKMETGGMQLWLDIVQAKYPPVGKKPDLELAYKAMRKMVSYNKQDVKLLIDVYLKLMPFLNSGHPNYAIYQNNPSKIVCTKCGSSDFTTSGWRYMKSHKYRRYQCKVCNSRFDPPVKQRQYYDDKSKEL